MDDYSVSSLHESKNAWITRLVNILTPNIIEGLKSIFDEALKICKDNHEQEKYLLTFQTFVSRIPKWNSHIIETERKRICEKSGCNYLEEIVTCVHIIQLKLLSAIRAGRKQKKVDINIPNLNEFIHKVYIHVARKAHKYAFLFEIGIPSLQIQKNYRDLENVIQACIIQAVDESIPEEAIIRAYMDESVEEYITEEIKEQIIEDPKEKENKLIEKEIQQAQTHQVGGEFQPLPPSSPIPSVHSPSSPLAPSSPLPPSSPVAPIPIIPDEQPKLETIDNSSIKIEDDVPLDLDIEDLNAIPGSNINNVKTLPSLDDDTIVLNT